MRLIFMGSPEFALPSLRRLRQHYIIAAVLTQPDRRAGRGRKLTSPPVKSLALEYGLRVLQPKSLRDDAIFAQLRGFEADLIVVAAYGQILPPEVLDLPLQGCFNVHASLLPRWRGAAPIQAAILHGDDQTGITIMKMDPGLDTGPILSQETLPIDENSTSGELSEALAELGGRLLIPTLEGHLSGKITPRAQDDRLATYAPMLRKSDGKLDFSKPAEYLERQIRAFHPWPGSYLTWAKGRVRILKAKVSNISGACPASRVIELDGDPGVVTSQGVLHLLQVQPSGKKPMDGAAFLRGAPDLIGTDLDDEEV